MKISPALGSLRDVMREYPPSGKVAMETQYHIYIYTHVYIYICMATVNYTHLSQ